MEVAFFYNYAKPVLGPASVCVGLFGVVVCGMI